MRKLSCIGVLVFVFVTLFTACQAAQPKTFDEQLSYLKAVSEFAAENNMALSVSVNFDGRAGVYQNAALGIDTGVQMQATILANAGGHTVKNGGN